MVEWRKSENVRVMNAAGHDVTLYWLSSNQIWGCPNAIESGSEKPCDFVMYFFTREFKV
jgi:hypothetical protein